MNRTKLWLALVSLGAIAFCVWMALSQGRARTASSLEYSCGIEIATLLEELREAQAIFATSRAAETGGSEASGTKRAIAHDGERVPVPEPSPTSVVVNDSLLVLEPRLASLERRMMDLLRAVQEHEYVDPPPPLEVMQRAGPRNWNKLDEFTQDYVRDPEAAVDKVRFLSYDGAIERFGAPTDMTSQNRWIYWKTNATVGHVKTVELKFVGGYIVDAVADISE